MRPYFYCIARWEEDARAVRPYASSEKWVEGHRITQIFPTNLHPLKVKFLEIFTSSPRAQNLYPTS